MAERTIGPKELAQRALAQSNYAGKNARAPKAATIDNLKAATIEASKHRGKPRKAKAKR